MAIPSTGAYGAPEGVIFSYPVTVSHGKISVVQSLELSDFDRRMLTATGDELLEERTSISAMLA